MKGLRNTTLAMFYFSALALAQKVVYQYDRGMDFSQLHTYKWITIGGTSGISQITAENIVKLVNRQLAEKGLTQVSGQAPALYVGYQASVDETIDTGTLVIDFYNPAQKQLVWRGTATNSVNPGSNADKNFNNLQKAIAKLLKPFPPEAKK